MITDTQVYTQPTQAAPAVGSTYEDPRFNNGAGAAETIRRLLNYRICNEHYAKNGFWSPNNQYFIRGHSTCGGTGDVINATTGAIVRDLAGAYGGEVSFDPSDSDIVYYRTGNTLREILVSTGADSLVKDFGAALVDLGSSVDYIDASGRYFVIRYTGQTRVWDKVENVVYSGGIARDHGGGWVGITRDAQFIVLADGLNEQFYSYPLDHGANSIGAENNFFAGIDHADVVTGSNGQNYIVILKGTGPVDCFKVNVSTGASAILFTVSALETAHFSGVVDWCWISMETPSIPGGGGDPYRNEIIRVNIITDAIERYAHHRSDSNVDYYAQPRVCTSWDGTRIAWSCDGNGFTGSGDGLYALELSSSGSRQFLAARRSL